MSEVKQPPKGRRHDEGERSTPTRGPKIRKHGEGTVGPYKSSKGPQTASRARITISFPDGTKHRVETYGPTDQAALRARKRKIDELIASYKPGEQRTLSEYAAVWLQHVKDHGGPNQSGASDSTIADYAKTLRLHILPTLGDHTLHQITPGDVKSLQKAIRTKVSAPRKRKDGTLSEKRPTGRTTANKARKVLLAIYNLAMQEGDVSTNPVQATRGTGTSVRKERLWTPDEVQKVLHVMRTGEILNPKLAAERSKHDGPQESWYSTLIYVALSMGLRRGELCGLKWSDIRDGKLHIERSYSQAGGVWRLGPPKTPESRRALPIGQSVMTALEEHRVRVEKHRRATSHTWTENDWIFPSQTGTLIYPPNLGRRLNEYAEKAGVNRIRFHTLRKIFTTEFLRAGGSPKQAQYWLGHATSKLVMEVYAGIQEELDMRAAILDVNMPPGKSRTPIRTPILPTRDEDAREPDEATAPREPRPSAS